LPASHIIQLKGKVIDANGNPVVGTHVQGIYLRTSPRGSTLTMSKAGTDRNGEFEMEREAIPAILRVSNSQGDRTILRIDEKQTEATLRFGPLAQIHGRLVDDKGEIVRTGLISYECNIPSDPPGSKGGFQLSRETTKPDGDGRYV